MSEKQEQEYRLAAAECLEVAQHTANQRMRTQLLLIAQKWLERANVVFAKRRADVGAETGDEQRLGLSEHRFDETPAPPKKDPAGEAGYGGMGG